MSDGDMPFVEVASRGELDAWLADHHATSGSVWLVTWKANTPERYIPYAEIVETAIAWGWIDSLPRALDDQRTRRRLSPRQPGSRWSAVNKAIAERLMAEGRMQPAGLAAVKRAQADGGWVALDGVEAGEVPDDLEAALDARPPARARFDAFPRSARRAILEWIGTARTPETRARRVQETAEKAQANIRANQARQPKSATASTGD